MAWQNFLRDNSDAMLQAGIGLIGGRTASEQATMGLQGFSNGRKQSSTLKFLQQKAPELAQAVQSGAIEAGDAYKLHYQQQMEAAKPKNPFIPVGGSLYNKDDGTWLSPPDKAGGQDEYSNRISAARTLGLGEDDPAYKAFVLTGDMPKENQQALTTTDKKAILEADDLVASSQNAVESLRKARTLSDTANAGWFAGTRAAIGNNLPDVLVPNVISSPESSAATSDFDNAVVGNALTQLKAIFGGAPTEGERQILLELQGSSSQPREVRNKILERATEMAQRRLEFNKQRADSLRGGTYYKNNAGAPAAGLEDPLNIRNK